MIPQTIDPPNFDQKARQMVRVVYSEKPQPVPAAPVETEIADDHTLVREGEGAFLKVFDDIKLREDAALQLPAQKLPGMVVINADEFYERVAAHEANRQRSKCI